MKIPHATLTQHLARAILIAGLAAASPAMRAQTAAEPPAADATIRAALLAAARNALKQDDLDGAIFYYNRYLQQQSDDHAAALEFAGVLIQAQRFEAALAACDQALRNDPANPEARKLKAIALGQLGRATDALRIIGELRIRFPDDPDLRRIEAGFRAMGGDRQFSRDLYRDLLRAGLNNTRDWQDYLQLLAADRQWDLLIETYEKHRDRLTPNDHVRFAVIQARMARNEMAEVEALYDAMDAPDLRRDTALLIADRLAAAGRLDDAVRFLLPIMPRDEPDPNLTAKIALLDAYNKRPDRAIARIDALPAELVNDRVKITRAKIYWAAGRPGDALAELDRLALPDTQIEATLTRAGLLYDLQREWEIPPLLARLTSELQRADPADRKLSWCLAALAHIRFGEWDAARQIIQTFKEREPDDLAPDILAVLTEKAARRAAAYDTAVARLGMRLRDYQPGAELIRPALLDDAPAAAWRIAWNTRPSNPFAQIELAHATLRECDIPAAADLYAEVERPETRAAGLLGAAECAWRMQDAERLRRLAGSLQDIALNFNQLVAAARIMLKAGMDGMAESFLARIPEADADHPDARAARAAWLARNDRAPEARQTLAAPDPDGPAQIGMLTFQCQRLAGLAQDSADPVYQIARARMMALADWDSPAGAPDGALAAADILMQFDEYDQARELLERMETTHPRDLRVSDRLMTIYIRHGLYNDAETQARKILARRPGDAARRGILARMCVWQSDYPLAWRRYRELIADYPEDRLFPLEYAAKQHRASGRRRRAAPLYTKYASLESADREMVVESADILFLDDFSKAAARRYNTASQAFLNDPDLRQALDTAERRAHWGAYAQAAHQFRQGHDRKVDVRQDRIEGGARLPRGPDAFTLEAGAGGARFRFDDEQAETLNARLLAARARWTFTNGLDFAGNAELLDYQTIDSNWRADIDAGYRGMDGWKIAAIAGRMDVRDNYHTIRDGLQSSWLGAYAQWQPMERLEIFGQYRLFAIDAPNPNALLPPDVFTTNAATGAASTNAPKPGTWESNNAQEGVLEATYRLFFFPHSLRLWVNGYLYDTQKDNDMYWTPDGAFLAGQIGLHWRHTLGRRHFPGAPAFFYGCYAAIGKNSEGDHSPTLKGELGWHNQNGWSLGAEAGRIWGDKYEETIANARITYLF